MNATELPDPLAPWMRAAAVAHDTAHHRDGQTCRGTVSQIDDAARLRGAQAVTRGRAVSLEREIETRPAELEKLADAMAREKKQWQALAVVELPDGHGSVELDVRTGAHGRGGSGGDVITYDAHGIHNTHMDGFAHIAVDATWHGGIPMAASQTHEDTMVAWAQHGIATRAILLDIPAVRGTQWVTEDAPVTAADLDAALAATGVEMLSGDALLIYQGRDRFEAAGHSYKPGAVLEARPGIGESGAQWLAAHTPSVLVWDFHDGRDTPRRNLDVHNLIWALGLCVIDNALLGPAAAALREAGVSVGQLVAAPPAIHRSTGVLINPLLLF